MINHSLIILQWEAPFTWNYTSIQHYSVYTSNNQTNWNVTDYTEDTLEFKFTENLTECTEYNFTVVANNGLDYGTVSGGFPISK